MEQCSDGKSNSVIQGIQPRAGQPPPTPRRAYKGGIQTCITTYGDGPRVADLGVGHTVADLSVGHTVADLGVGHTVADLGVGHTVADLGVGHTVADLGADLSWRI